MSDVAQNFLIIRGRKIRTDANGLVSLKDIHNAAGFSVNRTPTQWQRLEITKRATAALLLKTKSSRLSNGKISTKTILYAKEGRGGDTFAHPVLALAYAEFLNPGLGVEVREIFLRYKAGDAKLADEILARSSSEANEWAGVRALGRSKRNELTQTLSAHQVKLPAEYDQVTNETYKALLGKTAKQLKEDRGLKKTASLRDTMPTDELVYLMASEQLAKERIEDENSQGVGECSVAASTSAGFIRRAIEADRANRKRR
jgi:hypothetical protein